MKTFVATIKQGLAHLLRASTALSMLVVFSVILVNALWRYGAGGSLVWGEEVAVYGMIFGVMFGIALANLEDRHVRFTIGLNALSARHLRYLLLFTDLVILCVGFGLTCSGYEFLSKRGRIDSPGLGIPMWTMQSAMVAGGVLLMLSSLVQFFDRLLSSLKKEETP